MLKNQKGRLRLDSIDCYSTSGFIFAINHIGKHGSSMAIAIVDMKIAPEILSITTSDSKDE